MKVYLDNEETIPGKMNENIICCPTCRQSLLTDNGAVQCDHCGTAFTNQNDILDFLPGNDFYWGEISLEQMRLINDLSKAEGDWFKIVNEQLKERTDLIQYFTDLSRMGWLFHSYKPNQNDVCVDIGSGLGGLSFKLARFYQQVYSVDGVLERLNFQVIRANQEHISNVRFVRSSLFRLPFEDSSVDLVVTNGVFEWIGLSDFSKKPDELQLLLLNEIVRILKPEGVYYLGIENRFGTQYFLGKKDHSNLRYTSLIPRAAAGWIMRLLAKYKSQNNRYYFPGFEKGYRTYTYSIWGYQKILKKAGFNAIDSNWVYPSYSFPKYSGPLDGESIRFVLDSSGIHDMRWLRLMVRLFVRMPSTLVKYFHRLFVPDFMFIASKASLSHTIPHDLREKFPRMKSFTRMTMGIRTEMNSVFYLMDKRGKVFETVQYTENKQVGDGQSIITKKENEVTNGHPLNSYHQADVFAAAEWLRGYQKETHTGYWSAADLEEEIRRIIASARELFELETDTALSEYQKRYIESIGKLSIPIVSEYGAYSPENILIEADGTLTVTECAQEREKGNPLLDAGCFIFWLLHMDDKSYFFDDNHRTPKSIDWFKERFLQKQSFPVRLAPAYFMLRSFERMDIAQVLNSEPSYVKQYWVNSLMLSLDYALSNEVVGDRSLKKSLVLMRNGSHSSGVH